MLVRLFVVLLLIFNSVICELSETLVNTQQGKVRGYKDLVNRYVYFLGIPYASVNVRFGDPGDPPTWNNTFNANRQIICKQYSPLIGTIVGTENCLTLNIYKPINYKSRKNLPVIIFIYGGGFFWGSNSRNLYEPKLLVRKNVIIVTINYRVGAFGFLCLRNKGAPGNVGLKDQVAAIKWVNKNIAAFGGDPNKITLFGESAGAISIQFFILTQTANAYFQRAIMDSGSVNTLHVLDKNPIKTAIAVGNSLNFNTTDTDKLLRLYRNATADEIVKATIRSSTNNAYDQHIFKICIEDPTVTENAIVTDTPLNLLNNVNKIQNISIIQGYNDKEGIMWATNYNRQGLEKLDRDFTSAIPDSFNFKNDSDKSSFVDDVRNMYFNDSTTTYRGLIDYFSDSLIMYPSVLTMEAFLRNSNISMYNYYFGYDSFRNINKLTTRLNYVPGANHADELFYLFEPFFVQFIPTTSKDLEIVDAMVTLWTNFAKTGDPSTKNIIWPKSKTTLNFLNIGNEIKVTNLPNEARMDFWKKSQTKFGIFD